MPDIERKKAIKKMIKTTQSRLSVELRLEGITETKKILRSILPK